MNDTLITLLADGPINTGPDVGKASPVGLFIVVLLMIAVLVLVWSMNRHLKKAREHFAAIDDNPAASTGPAGDGKPSGESGG